MGTNFFAFECRIAARTNFPSDPVKWYAQELSGGDAYRAQCLVEYARSGEAPPLDESSFEDEALANRPLTGRVDAQNRERMKRIVER